MTQNVAQQPTEAKFRKLKLSNEKITSLIVNVPGALDALLELGWQRAADEDGTEVLVLPAGKHMTMADVRNIDAAAERLADALKAKARADAAARSRPLDPEKERIRAQMEADRRERAARGPVTQGSVAVPRGEFGAKVGGAAASSAGGCGGGAVRCVHDAVAWRALLEEGRSGKKAVIVDFTATWCGPCKMMAPLVEQLAQQARVLHVLAAGCSA